MIRHTTLNRTRLQPKRRRGDNANLRHEWASEHESCSACWARAGTFGVWLQTHHLLNGRFGRPDDCRNFLRLCNRCHSAAEGLKVYGDDGFRLPKLTRAHCIFLKQESDPEFYDPAWLQLTMGRQRLPEPEAIPECYLQMRGAR